MTHEHDKLNEALREYHEPPKLSGSELDEMWTAIEGEAFAKRFASPSREVMGLDAPRRRASDAQPWYAPRTLLPLAAVLLLGVAIGRFALPRATPVAPETQIAAAKTDSVAVPEALQSTTSKYLGQTAALLVSLPADVRSGRADDLYLGRAHDLLLTTRLLLDSPASADPQFRTLLEDLELVLAQVVRLQSDQSRGELELIRQALEQRDVLPRLRTAAADISADD